MLLLASIIIIITGGEITTAQNCLPNSGRKQSPIKIETAEAIVNYTYPPLVWSSGYKETPIKMVLSNTLGSLQLDVQVQPRYPLMLKCPFASMPYQFLQLHFHWGDGVSDSNKGGEHYINEDYYPLEMHAVHRQSVSNKTNEFLVVGYLFKVTKETNVPLQNILDVAIEATEKGNATVKAFPLSDLLYKTAFSYFTYEGSLTTDPFTEKVTWIVASSPFTITQRQLDIFRQAASIEPTFRNNYRCLQPLYDRKVIFSLS